jgi:bacteriocin-like protein
MSYQTEHEHSLSQIVRPEELRRSLLAEIETSQQVITELSDEELEEISGGEALYGMYKKIASNRGMGTESLLKRAAIKTGVHIIVGTVIGSLINNYIGNGQSSSDNQ